MGLISRTAAPESGVAPSVSEGIRTPLARPMGILSAEVREGGRIVERLETRNTIVTHGVAAMALGLLPAGITKKAAAGDPEGDVEVDASANPYAGALHINHWRMGYSEGSAASAPTVADTDLQFNAPGSSGLHETNGDGPWFKPLTAANITVKSLSGITLSDVFEVDSVGGFSLAITMAEGEGNNISQAVQVRKTYREAGIFLYYPTGATPEEPFPGTNSKERQERLFARATLDTLVKTPTRQIALTWMFAFPAN